MRDVQFGRFEGLRVQNGEPAFDPPPRLVKVKRIGSEEEPAASELEGWLLKDPIVELLGEIAALGNGTIARLEFRHGLPCLVEFSVPPTLDSDGGGGGLA